LVGVARGQGGEEASGARWSTGVHGQESVDAASRKQLTANTQEPQAAGAKDAGRRTTGRRTKTKRRPAKCRRRTMSRRRIANLWGPIAWRKPLARVKRVSAGKLFPFTRN